MDLCIPLTGFIGRLDRSLGAFLLVMLDEGSLPLTAIASQTEWLPGKLGLYLAHPIAFPPFFVAEKLCLVLNTSACNAVRPVEAETELAEGDD